METENGNRFYDESGNQEQENSYNRFSGNSNENNQGARREGRPRFVRVDYNNNRPQYSRVERPARQDGEGYNQDRRTVRAITRIVPVVSTVRVR